MGAIVREFLLKRITTNVPNKVAPRSVISIVQWCTLLTIRPYGILACRRLPFLAPQEEWARAMWKNRMC